MPAPIYTPENCRFAYPLNWSLSLFPVAALPPQNTWLEQLRTVCEVDEVRLLECRGLETSIQFLVSTKPHSSPAEVIRSIKGRLQYLLRDGFPKLWHRNYRLESVGETNNSALQQYVARQSERHRMADERTRQMLEELQFRDDVVDLVAIHSSAHGQFRYNLHLVLKNTDQLHDVSGERLRCSREKIVATCSKKEWCLSRIGLVSNHMHILLGCDVTDSPLDVALSLLNNIAFAHGMRPMLEFSAYLGTFGVYDREAIRRALR